MDDRYYGLLKEDGTGYEKIEVVATYTSQSVKLKEPIQEEQISNLAVMRVIFGSVDEDGNYLLRVRDSGAENKYLVRFELEDEVRFSVIDFAEQEAGN